MSKDFLERFRSKLRSKDEFLMTLMKLRLGILVKTIFLNIFSAHMMVFVLKYFIHG